MRKFADNLIDLAIAVFGVVGIIVGGYLVYWLLISLMLHVFIFK